MTRQQTRELMFLTVGFCYGWLIRDLKRDTMRARLTVIPQEEAA